jgi:hypothetical protein
MTDDGWKSPQTITFGANAFGLFRLAQKLVEKQILTQQEAADVMVRAADDVRNATEGGSGETFGGAIASRYETFAGWLLGQNPKL